MKNIFCISSSQQNIKYLKKLSRFLSAKQAECRVLYKLRLSIHRHRNANSTVHEYLHAFYWSAMFIIGQHPRPTTPEAYVFVIVEVLLGLLLFATVLGHITQIVASISSDRKEFQGKHS